MGPSFDLQDQKSTRSYLEPSTKVALNINHNDSVSTDPKKHKFKPVTPKHHKVTNKSFKDSPFQPKRNAALMINSDNKLPNDGRNSFVQNHSKSPIKRPATAKQVSQTSIAMNEHRALLKDY